MVFRAIRKRRWPQFPLRGLILAMVAVSVMVLGVSRVRETKSRWDGYRIAKAQYPQQAADFETVFSRYNTDISDDPVGVLSPGASFTVFGTSIG